jgi:tetratricopeptide (TPR) repeat protein
MRASITIRIVTLLACAAIGLPVHAAPAEVRSEPDDSAATEATQLRANGDASFRAGKLDEALAAFERAHELSPDPTDLFNIGRIHEETGDLAAALARYQEFVAQPRLSLEERRAAAERIEVLRVLVKPDEPEAPKPIVAAPPPPTIDTGRAKPNAGRPLVSAGSTLLALGAAIAVGGGVGFGLAARRRADTIDALASGSNPDRLTLAQAEDIHARGRDFEALQITFIVSGSALALIGTSLLAGGLVQRKRALALAPVVGRRAIAFQARWRF